MTAAGAFGTGAVPLPMRFAYWITGFFGGTAISILLAVAVIRSGRFVERPWVQTLVIALLNTAFYTGLVWLVTRRSFPEHAPGLVELVPVVFLITLIMTAVNRLAHQQPLETHAAPTGAPPPRFLQRLPPKLRGADLYAVEAEDHYLRLHTSRGSDLILMRLSDAIAELEGIEGAQTHRSWWVAREAVEGASRGDGRAVLRLKSGSEAPVSRSYAKALRDEGWF